MRLIQTFNLWSTRLSPVVAATLVSLLYPAESRAQPPQPEPYCYAVADSGDNLVVIDKDGSNFLDLGATGTAEIEAIAFNPGDATLYAIDADVFGFLDYTDFDGDLDDSEFVQISADVGTCVLPDATPITIDDVDGLQFDLTRTDPGTGLSVLWGTVRTTAGDDILIQIDPRPGFGIVDTTPTPGFTGGATCVEISGAGILADIDDIAIDPIDGTLYAVNNSGGTVDQFVSIDPVTGAATIIGAFDNAGTAITDVEGMSFGLDGTLYGTTGGTGISPDDLWIIDTVTGETSRVGPFASLTDYEAVACLLDNLITGTVFFDGDENGVFDPASGDFGFTGATVDVYIDNNDDGQVDGGDTLLTSVVTTADGSYVAPVAQGNYVVEVDTVTLPVGFVLTTDNVEEADFANTDFGLTDPDNDFGFTLPPGAGDLDITKTSDAGGPVVPGQTITYTIVVTNNSGITHTSVEVSDALPPGVSYVPQSTEVTGPDNVLVRDEFAIGSYANQDGLDLWETDWLEVAEVGGGAGPMAGQVQIVGGALRLDDEPNSGGTPGGRREVNVAGCSTATFTFDFATTAGVDADDAVTVDVSDNGGGTFTTLEVITGQVTGSRNFALDTFVALTADVVIRFRVTNLYGGTDEFFSVDDVQILATGCPSATFDNIPAGANGDLVDGVPPNLTEPSDGFILADGETQTLTFQVDVDDPLDPNIMELLNIAAADSTESTILAVDQIVDPVSPGAIIGDRVWLDTDGDGVQDIGEEGIANITLELVADPDGIPNSGDEFVAATTTTDADGNYLFDRVYPLMAGGSYTVEVASSVPPGVTESPGNNLGVSAPIVVSGDEEFLDADFGYTAPPGSAVIGDYVWSDADGDGVQDPGEPGIGGVTVNLLDAATGAVVDTVTTAADGSYRFTGVAAGEYRVEIDPANFLPSGALENYSVTNGPQSQGAETSVPIRVAGGDVFVDADFGYNQPGLGSIGDQIWYDADGDGVRDTGEDGIAGVTIDLVQDTDGDGVRDPGEPVIATVTTAVDGSYLFEGLALDDGDGDADYLIVVSDTAGELAALGQTTGTAGLNDNGQSDPYAVALSGGTQSDATADFGYNAPGTLGDRVWSDADGNGVQDASEPGIGGVVMALVQDPGPDGTFGTSDDVVLATTTTDAGGDYVFSGLPQGDYTVVADVGPDGVPASGDEILAAAGYTQTGDPEGDNDGLGSSTLPLGGSDRTLDFGYQNTALADISGTVFEDLDADGVEEAGEPGIEGVTVSLLDDLGNVIATTTTDANGDYIFPDLPDGDYTVVVTDDAGVLDGYQLTSGLDALDVTISGAMDVTDVDFGYTQTPPTGSIGDTVFLDADGDGIQDAAEAGLPGVTVNLLDELGNPVLDGMGNPITAVTDADGRYVFPDLGPGVYQVEVDAATLPAGLTSTTGGDTSTPIPLAEGEMYVDADFGYRPDAGTATFGDRVWADVDGDGLQDPGEIGIAGVDLTIDGPSGTFTVTTGPDGLWLATGLLPGDYFVTVDTTTLPAGYMPTPTNTDVTYGVTVADGDALTHLDYGFTGATTGSIGDTVYLDSDADGTQDAGEPGIAGVTLNLVDAGGNIVATTTTDANGNYLFQGLPPGDYTVEVTDVDGAVAGLNATEAPAGAFTITGAGEAIDTADFGFTPAGVNGVLGDFVWHDLDGDGVQDPGEPGFPSVTLDLWLDVDGDGVITPGVDNLLQTTTTDANGAYEFSGLAAGDYLVELTDTAGVLAGFLQTSDPDEPGVCVVCDNLAAATLAAGATDATIDFGYAADPLMAFSISGTVFEDQDNDANHDEPGEPGAPGATVELYRIVNGTPILIATTTADANGDYTFTDLPPGDYEIVVDSAGSPVDGYLQTTQGATDGVQPVTIVDADIVDQDFGFWNAAIVATPVTLAYFEAIDLGGAAGGRVVRFEWMTSTEVGNVGFNLYTLDGDGMIRLNEELIGSAVVHSIEPQRYTFEAEVHNELFVLEDVDIHGALRFHGPFSLDRPAGSGVGGARRTDWPAIRAAHEARRYDRQVRRAAGRSGRDDSPRGFTDRRAPYPSATLRVTENGIHRVTHESLIAEGIDLSGAPLDALALTSRGATVPIRVHGVGGFGPGAFIEFVGEPLDTLYTKANVYQLTVDAAQAQRISLDPARVGASAAIAPYYIESLTVESNRGYSFAAPGDDPWYDESLLAISGPVEMTRELHLGEWVAGAAPVRLELALWGGTDFPRAPDHHVIAEVNGVEVAEMTFDGLAERTLRAEVADSILAPGNNTIGLRLPHDTGVDFDLVHYDRYRVDYPRRFVAQRGRLTFTAAGEAFRVAGLTTREVSVYRVGESGVERLRRRVSGTPGAASALFAGDRSPATYYVSSATDHFVPAISVPPPAADITSREAQLLVISHPDFIDNLRPFVELRRSAGLSVEVVDVEAIYEQFGDGIFDARAIRDYLRLAHDRMGTRYVLLVGGDTYDYHDYLAQDAISFIPSLYAQTDEIVRFAPVDPLYADTDGDLVPDMAIGRWPVRTVDELEAVIDKTLEYDGVDPRVVLAADGYDAPSGFSFTAASEAMASLLPVDWPMTRSYIDELGLDAARDRLLLEMNAGVSIASYFGHSGPTVWSFDGLFDGADAAELDNAGTPMIVTQWGCWNTYYVAPSYDTLGHELLLGVDRGAAAVLGAATLTEAISEQRLGVLVFEEMSVPGVTVGAAIAAAKRRLADTDPDLLDVLLGWTLLGDPTLRVSEGR